MMSVVTEALASVSLADIPFDQVHEAQQAAVMRLHLFVLGEVHEKLGAVLDDGRAILSRAPADEPISNVTATLALQSMLRAWDNFIAQYTDIVARAINIAASCPFGVLAIMHENIVRPNLPPIQESYSKALARSLFLEALNPDVVFQPQLQAIINAVYQRTEVDGLNLSRRIWQLDTHGRLGLNTAVSQALANGDSAWQLAQAVEQFLQPGQDCPRWTRDRLNGLTKADIASGDRTGLLTGHECAGGGVAYKALRLARTEIQASLNMATVDRFRQMPFITMEKINLSPEHAHTDICDTVASGGENSDGTYPVGEIVLPVHPHCLCYRTAVLMSPDLFTSRLRDWAHGRVPWAEMDTYQQMIGGDVSASLMNSAIGVTMAYWLWGDAVELGSLFWNMALGRGG